MGERIHKKWKIGLWIIRLITIILLIQLISIVSIYNVKGEQFNPPVDELYNPFNVDLILSPSVSTSTGYITFDDATDACYGRFYLSGNVNFSLPLYVVWSITPLISGDISVRSYLGSIKSDCLEPLDYNIENSIYLISGCQYYSTNFIRQINTTQYEKHDIILIGLTTNPANIDSFYVLSCTIYYGIDEITVNFINTEDNSLEDYEWYFIVTFFIMVLNLVALKTVDKKFENMSMLFLIIGLLINSIGLIYLDTPLYPFVQLTGIMYTIILNFRRGKHEEII